jgi:hypothetical protein
MLKQKKDIFLRDSIKKNHGFLAWRRRKLSYTDAKLEEVFEKLYCLVESQVIERFRIVFGSDLVQVRFTDNPIAPATYRTDIFLEMDFSKEAAPDIYEEDQIPGEHIIDILNAMKILRSKEHRFLEAYRINSFANSIWAYFSSGKSLEGDYQTFLNYTDLRDEHDRVNAEMASLLTFYGDEFEGLADIVCKEGESDADKYVDEINKKTACLFDEGKIFEFQLYSGSGLIRVITTDDPHSQHHFTIEQYLSSEDLESLPSYTLNQMMSLEHTQQPNQIEKDTLKSLLSLAKDLRNGDDELYLRVLYVDALNDMVVSSFSCGGTYCKNAYEFLESGFNNLAG